MNEELQNNSAHPAKNHGIRSVIRFMEVVLVVVSFSDLLIKSIPKLVVAWNHSRGVLQNLNDMRYHFAAHYTLMDMVALLLLTLLWTLFGVVVGVLSRLHAERKARIQGAVVANPPKRYWMKKIHDRRIGRRIFSVLLVISIVYLAIIVGLLTENYFWISRFQRNCTAIRPFISDKEYYQLNRAWVTMTSAADYHAIEQQVNNYSKRIDLDKRVELLNQMIAEKYASQDGGR